METQEGGWVTAKDAPRKTPNEEGSREAGPEPNEKLGNASQEGRSLSEGVKAAEIAAGWRMPRRREGRKQYPLCVHAGELMNVCTPVGVHARSQKRAPWLVSSVG